MDYCTAIKIVDEALQPVVKREKSGHEVIYIMRTCIYGGKSGKYAPVFNL